MFWYVSDTMKTVQQREKEIINKKGSQLSTSDYPMHVDDVIDLNSTDEHETLKVN